MIFREMLASGEPQLLRVSKIMNQECTSLISKHGVYRIYIGFGTVISCPTITQEVANTVQNLHLRVHMMGYVTFALGRYPERAFSKMFKMFSNSNICRKSCSVSFEGQGGRNCLIALEVVYALKVLKGFEEVTLSIDAARPGETSYLAHMYAWQLSEPRQNRHVCLDGACWELEPHLGTAYLVEKEEGPLLVFYPRCSGRGVVKDSPGKEMCRWVKWEDRKEDTAM